MAKSFDSPIYVMDGGVLVQEIKTIDDALDYLGDWPPYRRNILYEATKRLCHAAHDGFCPIEDAHRAFLKWARLEKVLTDPKMPEPWMRQSGRGRGGVPV